MNLRDTDSRRKEVWLDARGLERETLEALTKEHVEPFGALLVGKEQCPLPFELPQTRVAVEVVDDRPDAAYEAADLLVYRDADLLRPHGEHAAQRAFASRVTEREGLVRMASILRDHRFDYGILELEEITNIPLEFLIAWFQESPVQILKRSVSIADAEIAAGTLERGADGVLLATRELDEIQRAGSFLSDRRSETLELVEWEVTRVTHVGMGHRACVDVTSLFTQTEGMLVGSFCEAMILVSSETHPLPYMPLRPFRVNAGGIHSYILGPGDAMRYLGDLEAGARMLAVDVSGAARPVVVGRVKIERRPLRMIEFVHDGFPGSAFVQDDWHVRVTGAGGEALNVTSCRPGTTLLGFRARSARHCGLPISEELIER